MGIDKSHQKLLIIGAGASFGARMSHAERPPLGKDLLSFIKEKIFYLKSRYSSALFYLGHHLNVVEDLLKTNKEQNFEKFIATLDRTSRESLHRVLQILFSDLSDDKFDFGFNERQDDYDTLVKMMRVESPLSWSVLTLNYDILFEQALKRCGVEFHYPQFPRVLGQAEKEGVKIYKPHGSINFFCKADIRISYGKEPDHNGQPSSFRTAKNGDLIVENPIQFCGGIDSKDIIHKATEGTLSPVIANFTEGKEADYNLSSLEAVRSDALMIAKESSFTIVIGINPNTSRVDDELVFNVLRNLKEDLYISTYGKADEDAYRRLFPNALIDGCGLDTFLKKIKIFT